MCACPACESPETTRRPSDVLRRLAFFAAAVALMVVVLVLGRQPAAQPTVVPAAARFDSPDAAVAALVGAEQSADVEGYKNCFAGELREKLEAQIAETAGANLLEELRSRAINLTGHVTADLQQPDADNATLVLERVFRNHNSRSRVSLKRFGGEWKITELNSLDNFAPEIPYGTPVFVPPIERKSQNSNSKSQTNSKSEREK